MFIVFGNYAGQRGGGTEFEKSSCLLARRVEGLGQALFYPFGIDPFPGGFSRDRSKGGCGAKLQVGCARSSFRTTRADSL